MATSIDAATVQAYRETEYRVLGTIPAVLRVSVRCADLAVLQRTHQAACSAFITACNPFGRVVSDRLNARKQQALREELTRRGFACVSGIGVHPSGKWRGEPSFLALGLGRDAAIEVGHLFEQNALIWAGADAVPELILLR